MSRTVSKILAICAMVVVIPLMIVGTAFVAFYATDRTVNVSTYFVDDVHAEKYLDENNIEVQVPDPQLSFGDVVAPSHKIVAAQSKTVKVSAQASVAYEFKGWFAGDVAQYKEATKDQQEATFVATTLAWNIDMQKAKAEYLAVYSVVRYNVKWSYKAAPEDGTETTTTPTGAKDSYIYGEKLPVLEYEAADAQHPDYTFAGWQVKGGSSSTIYKNAIFANDGTEGIVLTASWLQAKYATVKFFDESNSEISELEAQVIVGASLALPDATATTKDTDKAGYEYYWVDAQGERITDETITPADENTINVYLHREAVTYTAQVVDGEATYTGAEEIAFTRDNHADLDQVFQAENWTVENKFWEFGGISWNGAEQTSAADFVNAFIAANPESAAAPATLTVNVIKNYTSFSTEQALYLSAEPDDHNPSTKVQHHTTAGDVDLQRSLPGTSTSMTLGELFGVSHITYSEDANENKDNDVWYAVKNGERHKLSLREIKIEVEVDGEIYTMTYSTENNAGWETKTLDQILNEIIDEYETDVEIIKAITDSDVVKPTLEFKTMKGIYEVLDEVVVFPEA